LTSSFLIGITFISFACLTALAKKSSTLLNKSRDSGHLCLIPDIRENGFSFPQFSAMLAVSILYITFIYQGTFLLFIVSWGFLLWSDVEFC
jgi:hypothetical protein